MHKDGLITLPPPRPCQATRRPHIPCTARTNPQEPITTPGHGLADIQLQAVAHPEQQVLWREDSHRYHDLGYTPWPGAQLRDIATSGEHILALLGFGAAAWKIAPRDHFSGWSPEPRQQRLHLVVNNARFLILPWVASKNLAAKLLGLVARRLPDAWRQRYGYRPVLLETFVETQRFPGTCYKAANWL
jgi:hypothetical protein